jgi:hypothetical protein
MDLSRVISGVNQSTFGLLALTLAVAEAEPEQATVGFIGVPYIAE